MSDETTVDKTPEGDDTPKRRTRTKKDDTSAAEAAPEPETTGVDAIAALVETIENDTRPRAQIRADIYAAANGTPSDTPTAVAVTEAIKAGIPAATAAFAAVRSIRTGR